MSPNVTMLDSLSPTQAHTDWAGLLPAAILTHQPVPGVSYQQPSYNFLFSSDLEKCQGQGKEKFLQDATTKSPFTGKGAGDHCLPIHSGCL